MLSLNKNMKPNWTIIAIAAVAIIILLIVIYRRNKKDKADLRKTLNEDYKSIDDDESEPNDENHQH